MTRMSCVLLLIGFAATPALAAEESADHAVVLLYHHVADDTPASTSVRPDRFAEHLDWLSANDYQVVALEDLLGRLEDGRPVPDRAVAITFDDAWASVHDVAAPMLSERGWPFTVFVNTDAVDAGEGPVMSWDQLRALEGLGGSLGSHSSTHAQMPARRDGESTAEWRKRIDADLARAVSRIEEETGQVPRSFAYPYGEDSAALAERVGRVHSFALVQRSGAVGPGSDFLAVPRFPLAVGFDGLDRLERAVRARPLPVREARTEPDGDGVRDQPLSRLTLVLEPGGYRADALACYSSGGDALELSQRIDASSPVIDIALAGLDRTGRNKINCTAPATDGSGDWHWYAYQWLRPPLE
jgi:peptidoglycan/xylan/chitin deacetylase (PgdA/CDA1 family)